MAKTARSKIRVRPTMAECEELFAAHQEAVYQVHQHASEALVSRVNEFLARPPFEAGATPTGLEGVGPEPYARPFAWSGGGFDGKDTKIDELAEYRAVALRLLDVELSRCPRFTFGPPYYQGTPLQPQITTTTDWYPVSVAHADPQAGRIEVGALADRTHSCLEYGSARISTAEAGVGILMLIAPSAKVSTVTVKARACVDAQLQGLAPMSGTMALAAVGLFLHLTTSGTVEYTGTYAYNKTVTANSSSQLFNDSLNAEPFILSKSFDLQGPDYLVASLSVQATAIATKGAAPISWNNFACADVEGYSKPNGEYYPRAGSVFVSGFSVQICPKP